MSFNIRYGTANDGENSWPFRREATLEFLRTCSCDLIGMQEVLAFQLAEIKEAAPWYDWVGVAREDGEAEGEFAAILYDTRRVKVSWSSTFWFSDTPDVVGSTSWGNELTRICTFGSFSVDDHIFDFYNLHIDHESAVSRLKSVEMLAYKIHSRPIANPVIVTGDFNEGEQGPAVQRMLFAGFLDTYRFIHPEGPEQTSFHGWKYVTLGDKIDYVFTFGDWTVLDSKILHQKIRGRFLSDHYPVVAVLTLGTDDRGKGSLTEPDTKRLKFPHQDPVAYLEMLAQAHTLNRGHRFWSEMIVESHNRFAAVPVKPAQVLLAIESVGKALFEDRGEEPPRGLSNYKSLTSISRRLRNLVVASGFDRETFGSEVVRYLWQHPESIENRYLIALLHPLLRRVGGIEGFRFFRLLYRFGNFDEKFSDIHGIVSIDIDRAAKFLSRISSKEQFGQSRELFIRVQMHVHHMGVPYRITLTVQ